MKYHLILGRSLSFTFIASLLLVRHVGRFCLNLSIAHYNTPNPARALAHLVRLFSFNFQLSIGKYQVNPLIRMNHHVQYRNIVNGVVNVTVTVCVLLFVRIHPLSIATYVFSIGFMSVPFAFSHSVISLHWKAIVGFLC